MNFRTLDLEIDNSNADARLIIATCTSRKKYHNYKPINVVRTFPGVGHLTSNAWVRNQYTTYTGCCFGGTSGLIN